MNQGIRTFIYPVKDAQRASTLFRKLLNAEPLGFRIADQEIGLDPNGHKAELTGPVGYWNVPDIKAALESLIAAGAQLHQQVKDVGAGKLVALIEDPEGNVIGLIQAT
jgi:hypothetical protein